MASVGTQILPVDTGSRSRGLRCTDTRQEGSTQRPVTNAVRLYRHSHKHKADHRKDMRPKHARNTFNGGEGSKREVFLDNSAPTESSPFL